MNNENCQTFFYVLTNPKKVYIFGLWPVKKWHVPTYTVFLNKQNILVPRRSVGFVSVDGPKRS